MVSEGFYLFIFFCVAYYFCSRHFIISSALWLRIILRVWFRKQIEDSWLHLYLILLLFTLLLYLNSGGKKNSYYGKLQILLLSFLLRPFAFDIKNKTRDTFKNFKHMRAEKYLLAISEEGISCNGPNPEGLIKHIFLQQRTLISLITLVRIWTFLKTG